MIYMLKKATRVLNIAVMVVIRVMNRLAALAVYGCRVMRRYNRRSWDNWLIALATVHGHEYAAGGHTISNNHVLHVSVIKARNKRCRQKPVGKWKIRRIEWWFSETVRRQKHAGSVVSSQVFGVRRECRQRRERHGRGVHMVKQSLNGQARR